MRKLLLGITAVLIAVGVYAGINSGWPYANQRWPGFGSKRDVTQFVISPASDGGSSNFYPGVTNTNALGSTSYRFSNVFSVLGNFSGTVTNATKVINTPATVQSVKVATTTLTPTGEFQLIGSTGAITLAGTPSIATGTATNGQLLTLLSTAAVITLQDQATLANSGLALSAATVTVTTSTPVELIYYNSIWYKK